MKKTLGKLVIISTPFLMTACLSGGGEKPAPGAQTPVSAPPASGSNVDLSSAPLLVEAKAGVLSLGWQENSAPTRIEILSAGPEVSYECRIYKTNSLAPNFSACDGQSGKINSFSLPQDLADGAYQFEVRLAHNGQSSPVRQKRFYLHSSLNSAPNCLGDSPEEAAYFDKAREYLSPAPAFSSDAAENSLTNPEIKITFESVHINILSLRRKFAMSTDGAMILMRRQWASRQHGNCEQMVKTGFTNGNRLPSEWIDCPVMVFNKTGQGVCLKPSADRTQVEYVRMIRSADRKLASDQGRGMFSSKTKDPAKSDSNTLLIPD